MATYNPVQGSERPVEHDELEDPTFAARLEAAVDEEPRAVEELVREFQPNLTAYARSRRFPDPDGVVNEALSDGLQNLTTFRGRDRRAFRAYLYRILRRRIVDEYRRSARLPDTVAGLPTELEAGLIDEGTSSFDENIVAESAVDEILATLTTEQREVLEMRVLTGLSIRETAELTGRSETAVKAMHRRALRSLRTFLIAAAVLILGILGVRLLLGLGGTVSLVDNSPAGEIDRSLDQDPPPETPVVEVEVGQGEAGQDEASDESLTDDRSASPEPLTEIPASQDDDAPSTFDAPFIAVGSPITASDTAPKDTEPAAQPGPQDTAAVEPVPSSPCVVRVDNRPRPGEIAFVSFDFSGPYEFLDMTSIDVPGADGSAVFPGTGRTSKVKDGRTFPIILDESMFDAGEALMVTATFGNGEIQAPCSVSEKLFAAPCIVAAGEDPQVGDSASIEFRAKWPWSLLKRKQAHPLAPGRVSSFPDEATVELADNGPHEFALTENMLSSKRPWVTIAILGPGTDETERVPVGRAVCERS